MGRPGLVAIALAAALAVAGSAGAQPAAAPPASSASAGAPAASTPALLDRVVVRWHAPETGGVSRPQFVFERELAFAARIESLADPDADPRPYSDRHVRAALDRQIAETLLSSLPVVPVPTPLEVAQRAESARAALEQRAGGRPRVIAAAKAEGIGSDELDAVLRREARASFYLDRMVAPMLEPSDFELRSIFRAGTAPFKDKSYEVVAPLLKRWVVSQRLAQALDTYYQDARSRVVVSIVRAR